MSGHLLQLPSTGSTPTWNRIYPKPAWEEFLGFSVEDCEEQVIHHKGHHSNFGFKHPLHGFFSQNIANDKGTALWESVNGNPVEVTRVTPGEFITPNPGEVYVGDVVSCLKGFDGESYET